MAKQSTTTLRDRLRDDTRDQHEALDAALGTFDLTTRDGLAAFLTVQIVGFAQMRATPDLAADLKGHLGALVDRARADLKTLGRAAPPVGGEPEHFDPAALRYILLGSRMGTAVLRRDWLKAEDPAVKAASSYFASEDARVEWRAFCDWAAGMPAHGERADRIVEDATRLFDLFHTATLQMTPHGELQHA